MKTKTVTKVKRTAQKLQGTQQISEEDIINAIDQHGKIEEKILHLKEKHIVELQTKIDVLVKKHIKPLVSQQEEIQKVLKEHLDQGITKAGIYEAMLSERCTIPLLPEKVFKKVSKKDFFNIVKVTKKEAEKVMTKQDMIKCEGEPGNTSISLKIRKIK